MTKTKKILRTIYFTENGKNLAEKIFTDEFDYLPEYRTSEKPIKQWVRESFECHLPVLFIGATGIAVREIAPFIQNKLTDSAVVVMDELGKYAIPILSGHYGRANRLAQILASKTNAIPVITTATDINKVYAIDEFAAANQMRIADKSRIKNVSKKFLDNTNVTLKYSSKGISFTGQRPDNIIDSTSDEPDIIITDYALGSSSLELIPKRIVLGIGCKKGKSFEELKNFVDKQCNETDLMQHICAICSIDLKAEEYGLIKLSQYYHVPFITFSSDELKKIKGDFEESEFVKETTGIGNVCERAAIAGASETGSHLIKNKVSENGMTLAMAKKDGIIIRW